MKQLKSFGYVFIFLLAFAFASAVPEFVSPVENSNVFGGDVLFNISVPLSVLGVDYNGDIVCTPDSNGYCTFLLDGVEFNSGVSNTVFFNFIDSEMDFSDEVSFYYNVPEFVSPVENSNVFGGDVLFNISVGSAVNSVFYDGTVVCGVGTDNSIQDGYCVFTLIPSNFKSGELNEVNFSFSTNKEDFEDSVSFYFNVPVFNSPKEYNNQNETVTFNISVGPSIIAVLYNGEVRCSLAESTISNNYCVFEMDYAEFNDSVNNTLVFDFFSDNEFSQSFSFVWDITAPKINVVLQDYSLVDSRVTLSSISTSGKNVYFNVSSNDNSSVNCDYASGSLFPIGNTTVTCDSIDKAGNIGIYSFIIGVTYDGGVVITPSGSSGGGSGSCTTQWTTSEWSECVGGTQTRTVSYPANYCAPKSDKPLGLRTCTMPVAPTNNTQIESQTTQPTFVNTLTGAVIGTNAGRWSLGVVLFLILVGLAWWIIAAKKRRAANKPVKIVKMSAMKKKK